MTEPTKPKPPPPPLPSRARGKPDVAVAPSDRISLGPRMGSEHPPAQAPIAPEDFPQWGAAAARSEARRTALKVRSKRSTVIALAAGGVLVLGGGVAAIAMNAHHSAIAVLANVDFAGPIAIAPNGDFYGIEGNAVVRKAGDGAARRIDFGDAPCRTERIDGRASVGSAADAIFVSGSDDRVVIFGTRSADAGERHVAIGCFGHLDTGATQPLEVAMPDLAELLGTADTSTLHIRAGSSGKMYVWSNEVPLTVFDGKGASSRLLAGEKSRPSTAKTETAACAIADASRLVIACAVPTEPGQADLRVSVFGSDWPPVRASYDVVPLSIDKLTDFALSADGSELLTWGSKRSGESGANAFDSHVALTTVAGKSLVFDTHWQAPGAILDARFDPDGRGIFVSQAASLDKMDISTLRYVPRAGWTAFTPLEFTGAFTLASAGAHKLWLVESHSAFAIPEPEVHQAEPGK